jgi:hypothetical protein
MLRKEEIDRLKSISIVDFLTRHSVKSKKIGANLFFSSPYREDPNPSLKVDERTNRWYDFGIGEGGDIIDLVKKMSNTDFEGAVQSLRAQSGLPLREVAAMPAQRSAPSAAPAMTVLHAVPIYHQAITGYLQERNVDLEVAKKRCRQVHYRTPDGKTYFALGFKNDSGGYELRNKYFKGCTSKDITIINPRTNQAGDGSQCLVFEGFMDYLSHLTISKHNIPCGWQEHPNDSVVVLNSVANLPKVKPYLEKQFAVATFLDNDDAGRQATAAIRNMVQSGHPVWDASICYRQHKDLNEYLMALPPVRQSQSIKNKL